MTFSDLWGLYDWRVYEVLWAIVSLVGLVIAVRRRRQLGRAWWFAITAFAILLLKSVYPLYGLVVDELSRQGYDWVASWPAVWGNVWQVMHILGFALLTAAVFVGRQPAYRPDPDDTP